MVGLAAVETTPNLPDGCVGWIANDPLAWFGHLSAVAFGLVTKHSEDSVGAAGGEVHKFNGRDFLRQSNESRS